MSLINILSKIPPLGIGPLLIKNAAQKKKQEEALRNVRAIFPGPTSCKNLLSI